MPLEIKSYWIVKPDESNGYKEVTLDAVLSSDGVRWAIRHHEEVMNKDGKWEYEQSPSNRDDDFKQRCRFDTLEDAIAIWESAEHE